MTVAELAGKILAPESPWFLVLAVALLVAAANVARRLWSSVRRIGERVGGLETLTTAERTRRQQVECALLELGVPLPVWPDDPPNLRELSVLRRRAARAELREDLDDEEPPPGPLTTAEPHLPPVPAVRPFPRHGSR